ncbi:glycosyltransferase family 2 protein [Thiocapsa marina]|uniref:Beta-monoglucosyldiacylglycerol synthase n=1 Tax=Thiocapsa marina 5811 TaxID=768671 RepID=F9UGR9_9GAMM|nr:glycosyltransferase [Thiocapsa marina]EGV16539.1 glycosyl transferase family 2 [Thiocapsa marina 5811]
MRHSSNILIPVLIALLTVAAWALLNRPAEEPPWPNRIQGFSFAPMRAHNDPAFKNFPTVEEIDEDLALLQGTVHAVRTYTVESTLAAIPRLAAARGLNVTLGAWIGSDSDANEVELARLGEILSKGYRNLVRVMVGNEAILREDVSVAELTAYLDRVRKMTWLPVSTAEPWHVWLKHPELAEHVDFITVHLLPYWEGVPVDDAVDYAVSRFNEVKKAFPTKDVIIGEVGWPSNGRRNRGAEASLTNQTRFLRRFLAHAEQAGYVYYVMEAFDQTWKARIEGATGAYWGVYNTDREPKFVFTQPVVRIPHWQELAGLSVVMGILLLVFLYRDSSSLSSKGKGFLALVMYGISTAAVWIVYDYTRLYMTPATAIVGILLLVGGVGVIVLIMAETHEWAEALWLRRWRRPFPLRSVPDEELPFVSIHVPAYNEPPELLIETLDALAGLDYPGYEVLVIDNNTKDPAVWEPVEAHCRHLNETDGQHFRFFHVDPLAGYKAGALNYALRETDPRAEVIAVIDADYSVQPLWLRHLVPAFQDREIAIVQAPQDYRDADQNAFKAMCMAEYRGFFHIGMVTRNERNAIIQHGTMTMIRRPTLDAVGGWAEWCITEDAELGLRLFEAGHKALYIPCTYGRGLMPDTFADFKKQRYRWAYGAVRTLKHHRRELLGIRKTTLSAGQRYHFVAGWLPWFADGFNLLFNFAALAWSVAMVMFPLQVTPPYLTVAVVPLVLFGFKMSKSFLLYRRRVTATLRQSFAAGLAGLALSHTIARAVFGGLSSGGLGFFRTPKLAQAPAFIRALADAREEGLFVIAFWLAAGLVMLRDDAYMLDVRVWVAVLIVQSIPYLAAVVVSLISAATTLPASLVGPMPAMTGAGSTAKIETGR